MSAVFSLKFLLGLILGVILYHVLLARVIG